MNEFQNQVLVVTGGASGIGEATVRLFAADGARVVLLDRNEQAGRALEGELQKNGSAARFITTDVTSSESVGHAVEQVLAEFGRIDILYANAAIQIIRRVDEMTEQEWSAQLNVNLTGTFLCCRKVIPQMRRQKSGVIVIASSGHAYQSYPGYPGYAATKGGLLAFMRAAALDCANDGIRVNCIVPGATETQLLKEHFENNPAEKQRLLERIPMARLATPEDIARGVRMLASEDARYITGTALVVDGGLLVQG